MLFIILYVIIAYLFVTRRRPGESRDLRAAALARSTRRDCDGERYTGPVKHERVYLMCSTIGATDGPGACGDGW